MILSPIIVFAYNRINAISECLKSLCANDEFGNSKVIIYSDAAKSPTDEEGVRQVRLYLENFARVYQNVTVIRQLQNKGLAESIISGVTEALDHYQRVIVVEDDLIVAPNFLKFMNESLHHFESESRISSIVGYSYPLGNLPDLVFLNGAECWGWATWKDRWDRFFEINGTKILNKIEAEFDIYDINVQNCYDYLDMLKGQISGRNNSWAVRWHLNNFINHQYSVYPGRSLVQNMGFAPGGTHCKVETPFYHHPVFPMVPVELSTSYVLGNNFDYVDRLANLFNRETLYFKQREKSLAKRFLSYFSIKGILRLRDFLYLRNFFSKYPCEAFFPNIVQIGNGMRGERLHRYFGKSKFRRFKSIEDIKTVGPDLLLEDRRIHYLVVNEEKDIPHLQRYRNVLHCMLDR